MSGFIGSAHDAIGQLQSQVERLSDDNARLIRALRQIVESRHDPARLHEAIDAAEPEIARALKPR